MKTINRRLKGFTIIEMVVVLAIIGALLGVLAPTMSAYYSGSRIKSSNADAKMIYNAAQTEVQKFIAKDRVAADDKKSKMAGVLTVSYANGTFTATSLSAGVTNDDIKPAAEEVVDFVLRTVSDSRGKCWTIYIDNYLVKGSVAADSLNTNLVGYYSARKTSASERSDKNYSEWLTGAENASDGINSLLDVKAEYDK